jgi:hypothetical protein
VPLHVSTIGLKSDLIDRRAKEETVHFHAPLVYTGVALLMSIIRHKSLINCKLH